MPALERIILHGFKSIQAAEVELHNLNLLIGANGSGQWAAWPTRGACRWC